MLKVRPIADSPAAALEAAMERAPYLRRLAARELEGGWPEAIETTRLIARPPQPGPSYDDAMRVLRQAKQAAHLSLAGEDLSGTRDVMDVTLVLTELASECVDAALRVALSHYGLTGEGIFAIALGKMGAFELNYSSDIDFCLFYDPDVFDGGERSPGEAAQRVARDIVRLLDEITADGYVFRTDLRLRPDPSSTPLAVSTAMAELYYESVGQNWERMVWIKARSCAGDRAAGEDFIRRLEPYVWRRHLDYWAIGDIQAIKRMINTKAGAKAFDIPGPDIKLGPGGIREIEFFVQTQQLILGGRRPELRDNSTLGAMEALRAGDVVADATAVELSEAYRQLRAVEHRIQMRHDEQTHTVPSDPAEREHVAALCGYGSLADFDRDLLETRRLVQAAYDKLFALEDRAAGESPLGNLVFTGVDDDPGTVETLSGLGFSNPSAAIDSIRNWHRGRVPATRTARGRELLTAILPRLLEDMGKTGEADEAFRWFSRFFEGLSSGVQTLAMLLAEPDLLDDLVATLALAPRLAEILSRRPDLLEALVSGQAPARPQIDPDTSFDAALDLWRRYHREQNFLIGHRLLHGLIPASDAAQHWTALADETIREMSAAAAREIERRHGPQPGRWGVFAMGKLGGSELTAGSDLDIIVIYDADPLEAQAWYTRFTQRLITALTAPTAEGELYEVDMRLRPSGRAGPVAVSLPAFETYQEREAWTWEHMALTRLRPVAGDEQLGRDVLSISVNAITARAVSEVNAVAPGSHSSVASIQQDISDMRQRLYREKPGQGLWDLKTAEGGLVDAEFIVQQAMLLAGDAAVIRPSTLEAIGAVSLAPEEKHVLREGVAFLQSLQQVQRLAIGTETSSEAMPAGLRDRLCRAVGAPDFEALEAKLSAVKSAIHTLAAKKLHLTATDK
ncbi:MAG: bifunctional [glutamine synthetase] adenylyltransferase/[glutamine synthetase]-adenylyl-L-tyrosine phosphorylase [Hyphomonas sp.]|uniref:bifunctional [glutamine synthetase] adenylyltransferase/[glutamine synthetase]-adenylyl-L-tyrosine phosphorylase n=1 Tax=Hyphomonas sp. TaxID=87 RepID=UPI0035296F6E